MSAHAEHIQRCRPMLWLAAVGLAFVGLLGLRARPAEAAYEQVGHFAGTPGLVGPTWPEEVQLGGVSGLAVNYTGAGGVPAGTIYAATGKYSIAPNERFIARYRPDGSFSERWSFEGSPIPQQRCGPDGNAAEPHCPSFPMKGPEALDVDVDQATGDVYVFNSTNQAGTKLIHVYTPDGSELIAEFAERSGLEESISESPGKVHSGTYPLTRSPMVVDNSGNVYLRDEFNLGKRQHRIMKFEPLSPGDYAHYIYAGQNHDFTVGEEEGPAYPAIDAAGNIYAVSNTEDRVLEYNPAEPTDQPICEYHFARAGIEALTVNPISGELFFWTYKDRTHIYRLSPCEGGKFTEEGTVQFSPSRGQGAIGGMAVDPLRHFSPGRPAGIVYMAAATGEGGASGEASLGYIFAQPAEQPPIVEAESFSHVNATSAEVGAKVNPSGSITRYSFQYESAAEFQQNEPGDRFSGALESPVGGASAGDGTETVAVTGALVGLAPATSYRFRVVATSHCSVALPEKVCEATGNAEGFKTFPIEPPGLPDRRAYELVSPPEKAGGQVAPAEPYIGSCGFCKPGLFFGPYAVLSSADGDGVVFAGSAFNSEEAALGGSQYFARRNPGSGWQTVELSPAQRSGKFIGYQQFEGALGQAVFGQEGPALSSEAPPGYANLYSQSTADPLAVEPLLTRAQSFNRAAGGDSRFEIRYAGASADFSRIFFKANDALTGTTEFAPAALDGGASKFNLYEWHDGQLALVNVLPGNTTQPGGSFAPLGAHPVSADGSRAFFSDGSGQVYVREQGEVTRAVESEGAPDPAKFVIASADGSRVLLADGHLIGVEDGELLADLTNGKGGFQGVVGETESLSHIYFVDTEVLDGSANDHGEVAETGQDNLYSWAQGEGTRFVGRLLAEDNERGGYQLPSTGGEGKDWETPSRRTAEASPDGRFLTFVSTAPLTGYDNVGPCKFLAKGVIVPGPCQEAFVYDSTTGELACASCNPSGEPPEGPTYLRTVADAAVQPRYLSDDGRLLFDSRDSILPTDTNGGVEDVYQWEPDGTGSCSSEFAEGGCVSLISAGTGSVDSNFLAMDPSGDNVFFTTRDQLTLKDNDELIDLYDARVNGGIASESEVARSECQGEACQPPVTAPNDPTPGTSSLVGAGNVSEAVKPKKKHRNRKQKKHHKRRHAKANRGGFK